MLCVGFDINNNVMYTVCGKCPGMMSVPLLDKVKNAGDGKLPPKPCTAKQQTR
jgi:hypothetical protein